MLTSSVVERATAFDAHATNIEKKPQIMVDTSLVMTVSLIQKLFYHDMINMALVPVTSELKGCEKVLFFIHFREVLD